MPSSVFCSICQDNYAIAEIRSLPCGHTTCATCITAYMTATRATRGKYPCPHCRALFKNSDPHPIFLENGDSASQAGGQGSEPVCHSHPFHRQVASALKEVTRLEEDQRAQTVQRAAQEMEKVTELMSGRDCLLALLTAVAARWRGILPLFSTITKQRADIARLRGQLEEAREETTKAERVAEDAVKEAEKTLPTLKATQRELREAKIRLDQLEQTMVSRADEHKTELAEKNQEVSRLHDQLRALKAQELKQKQDIRKLREEAKPKTRHLQVTASRDTKSFADRSQGELEVLPPPTTNRVSEYFQTTVSTSSTVRKRKRSEDDDELMPSDLDSDPLDLLCTTDTSSSRATDVPAPRRPPPVIKPPSFSADPWQLPAQQLNRFKSSSRALQRPTSSTKLLGLQIDANGKALAPVQVGSRRRAKFV